MKWLWQGLLVCDYAVAAKQLLSLSLKGSSCKVKAPPKKTMHYKKCILELLVAGDLSSTTAVGTLFFAQTTPPTKNKMPLVLQGERLVPLTFRGVLWSKPLQEQNLELKLSYLFYGRMAWIRKQGFSNLLSTAMAQVFPCQMVALVLDKGINLIILSEPLRRQTLIHGFADLNNFGYPPAKRTSCIQNKFQISTLQRLRFYAYNLQRFLVSQGFWGCKIFSKLCKKFSGCDFRNIFCWGSSQRLDPLESARSCQSQAFSASASFLVFLFLLISLLFFLCCSVFSRDLPVWSSTGPNFYTPPSPTPENTPKGWGCIKGESAYSCFWGFLGFVHDEQPAFQIRPAPSKACFSNAIFGHISWSALCHLTWALLSHLRP